MSLVSASQSARLASARCALLLSSNATASATLRRSSPSSALSRPPTTLSSLVPRRCFTDYDLPYFDPLKEKNVDKDGNILWGTFDHSTWHNKSNIKRLHYNKIEDIDVRRRAQIHNSFYLGPGMKEKWGLIEEAVDMPDYFDELPEWLWNKVQREQEERSYMRKALFEMPKFKEFQKEFVPPTKKHVLKFETRWDPGLTDGEEQRTVKLSVKVRQLGLTEKQLHKFLLLIGDRYNPNTESFHMEANRYKYPAQNKKFLSDVFDDLIKEVKEGKDDFCDVPLDPKPIFQKYKIKRKYDFPKEWIRPLPKITAEERAAAKAQYIAHGKCQSAAAVPQLLDESSLYAPQ